MKRTFAFTLLVVMLLTLGGCQNADNDYLTVKYDDVTEYAFPAKNIKVVCDSDGCRVIDVDGEFGYNFEIVGFDSESEALEYAKNYK